MNLLENIELWANLATAVSVLLILATFVFQIVTSRVAHDKEIQLELSSRYRDFLRFCVEHPELQLFDTISPEKANTNALLGPGDEAKLAGMSMLISLFEDAYYLLQGSPNSIHKEAWSGWKSYIEYWMLRPDFSIAWREKLKFQYNSSFLAFMDDLEINASNINRIANSIANS